MLQTLMHFLCSLIQSHVVFPLIMLYCGLCHCMVCNNEDITNSLSVFFSLQSILLFLSFISLIKTKKRRNNLGSSNCGTLSKRGKTPWWILQQQCTLQVD